MVEKVNKDNNNEQQQPVSQTPPSRICQQPLWIDNLLPKPTWEESVKTKLTYLANLDWSKAFWNPLNGSETMNILAMKVPGDTKGVAQLWVIGKIEYTTLVINQFPSYTVKLCLTSDDWNNLRLMLRKWGNLGKDWDLASLESVLNFSTRPDKVEELIQLIRGDEKARDVVRTIHFQDTFPFTYDVWRSADIDTDYPNPGHNVNDFKSGARVAIEFQILSWNFKASKKVDTVKAYSFQLLGVYLVNDPVHSTMSIPDKCQRGDNKWMVTPPRTKKIVTSMNPLES